MAKTSKATENTKAETTESADNEPAAQVGITVNGLWVPIDRTFEEGHVVTAGEAAALSQTLRENTRNNKAKAVKSAMEEAGVEDANKLSDEVKDALIAEIQAYAGEYEFTVSRSGGGSSSFSPLMVEARRIARDAIDQKRANEGKKSLASMVRAASEEQKEQVKEAVETQIMKVALLDKVQAKAAENIKRREEEAGELGDLI